MTDSSFTITWVDIGREPQVAPNPAFPNGIDVMVGTVLQNRCKSDLPYPAPRCGLHHVVCGICGISAAITAAGRPDDPRSVSLPCRISGGRQ